MPNCAFFPLILNLPTNTFHSSLTHLFILYRHAVTPKCLHDSLRFYSSLYWNSATPDVLVTPFLSSWTCLSENLFSLLSDTLFSPACLSDSVPFVL